MVLTPGIQRQHLEICIQCEQLLTSMKKLKKETFDDTQIRKSISLLNAMLGKLLVHLSMKDKVLYPRALELRNNPVLAGKALELMEEMGILKESIFTFREEVMRNKTITDLNRFCEQTIKLLNVVKQLMKREELELYPLFLQLAEQKSKLLDKGLKTSFSKDKDTAFV
jgi:hypothetical protein